MAVLEEISFYKGHRDEVPNQLLAKKLAAKEDKLGITEIAENIWNKNKNIQSDCLKVLYEIGYIKPELIADYVTDFLKSLKSKNNRMVWGSMIALATIARLKRDQIWKSISEVENVINTGSVITKVWGIKTLAEVSAGNEIYLKRTFPFILKELETCESKLIPKHTENIIVAVNMQNKDNLKSVLESRKKDLKESQLKRIEKILKTLN